MNKESRKFSSRELMEEHFKRVETAIQGGKADNVLVYPELQEELVEKFKDKTLEAPLEVIFTSFLFLTAQEMVSTIETLKELVVMTFRSELLKKARNGEATKEDAMIAMMLAMLSMEEERKEKEDTTTEKDE